MPSVAVLHDARRSYFTPTSRAFELGSDGREWRTVRPLDHGQVDGGDCLAAEAKDVQPQLTGKLGRTQ